MCQLLIDAASRLISACSSSSRLLFGRARYLLCSPSALAIAPRLAAANNLTVRMASPGRVTYKRPQLASFVLSLDRAVLHLRHPALSQCLSDVISPSRGCTAVPQPSSRAIVSTVMGCHRTIRPYAPSSHRVIPPSRRCASHLRNIAIMPSCRRAISHRAIAISSHSAIVPPCAVVTSHSRPSPSHTPGHAHPAHSHTGPSLSVGRSHAAPRDSRILPGRSVTRT